MEDFRFTIKYRVDDVLYQTHKERCVHYTIDKQISDDSIKLIIHPTAEMHLLEVSLDTTRTPKEGEVFFGNGFQAWTTSREYRKEDKFQATCSPVRKLAKLIDDYETASGDYRFYTPVKGAGHFHGYTYTYYRTGEQCQLFGSLNEPMAYTRFVADLNNGAFAIQKDVEGKVLHNGEDTTLIDVFVTNGSYDEVFDAYFAALGVQKPENPVHMSGYTSWYNYFTKISEEIILRDLEGLTRAGDTANIFQIDDGYEYTVGDWLETTDKFPKGMKYLADQIHAKGFKAGLWLAPFNCTKKSKTYQAHKDWVIKQDGKPVIGTIAWGGAYVFDMYNEEFRTYIKEVFRNVFDEWGFDMVKLDFLYSQAMFPRNGKTRAEIMSDGIQFLRELVGDHLFLGCGVPHGVGFGIFDACRIGCDVAKEYGGTIVNRMNFAAEIPSAQNSMVNAIFRRHLNGRAFVNDPDVFFLRDFNIKFNMDQKLLLGFVNHLMGGVLFVSDDVGQYDDEALKYVKKFFAPSTAKIKMAEYVGVDDIAVTYEKDGETKTLKFNLKSGESNVRELLD